MIYVITNVTHTSDDQHRRGHRVREFRKGRVQIGPRSIDEGRSASISEELYLQFKDRIDHYVSIGMVKVQVLGGSPAVAEVSETPAVEAEVVIATPAEPTTKIESAPAVESDQIIESPEESLSEVPEEENVEIVAPKRKGRPPKEK